MYVDRLEPSKNSIPRNRKAKKKKQSYNVVTLTATITTAARPTTRKYKIRGRKEGRKKKVE